ncbi:MAG TPA: hypothetical protein VFG07_04395 [Thermoplasmata archaeon]|nr:hypothetical protein [Thermoplasmata archaeon]
MTERNYALQPLSAANYRRHRTLRGVLVGAAFGIATLSVLLGLYIVSTPAYYQLGGISLAANLFYAAVVLWSSLGAGVVSYRMAALGPDSLRVSEKGLVFTYPTGRQEVLDWTKLRETANLSDRTALPNVPSTAKWRFMVPPRSLWEILTFRAGRVPVVYLSSDAAQDLIDSAVANGVLMTKQTRYGGPNRSIEYPFYLIGR